MTPFDEHSRTTTKPGGLLRKVLTFAMTAALIVLALMFSALLFAVILTIGAVAGCYLWWKTRGLRKQMRDNPQYEVVIDGVIIENGPIEERSIKGEVIEGEVIREIEFNDERKR